MTAILCSLLPLKHVNLVGHPEDGGISHRNVELGSTLEVPQSIPWNKDSGFRNAAFTCRSEAIAPDGSSWDRGLTADFHTTLLPLQGTALFVNIFKSLRK